jgi:proteasome assembly chaperone (PAC2) family protein
MLDLVKIRARPKLNSPVMLAAWPGIGDVALIVAGYLRKKLDFKELAEVEPSRFFDPIGVLVRDNLVEEPQFPESIFFYWKNRKKGSDLILFIGEDQPPSKGYEMAHCVLDVAERFDVRRVYCCAAALTRIHHTEQSGVWGVATSLEVLQDLRQYNLVQRGNLQIAGLNGLLMGVAKERGIEGACLLGEVPAYASRMQNPMAALAVLKVFMKILNIDVDITELALVASETKEQMKMAAAEAMEKYIDYFTQPIWEQGEEGGYEEEDEEGV